MTCSCVTSEYEKTTSSISLRDDLLELLLRRIGIPSGIEVSGQLRRVLPPVDVRDLRRGERDDLELLAAAVDEIEIVEVAARRSDDQYPGTGHE